MDDSDYIKNQDTLREIAKAQRTLDEVEQKMKKFKAKKRQEPLRATLTKAPLPDLNQFFTFIEEIQNNEDIQFTQSQCLDRDEKFVTSHKKKYEFEGLDKENDSLTINQRLEKQKKSSICKLEEYYNERNETLDERIRELKQFKEKLIKDQKLLLRNNEELEIDIERKRQTEAPRPNLDKLQAEVRKMRTKIGDLENENIKIAGRNKELEKHIKQALKSHKLTVKRDMQSRAKSTSCKYH